MLEDEIRIPGKCMGFSLTISSKSFLTPTHPSLKFVPLRFSRRREADNSPVSVVTPVLGRHEMLNVFSNKKQFYDVNNF
jgi:hypothetical protein